MRLLLFGLALAISPATAQDFATFASSADLTNGGEIEVDFGCAAVDDGALVWYNFPTEELLAYNTEEPPGARTFVVRSAADLDADAGVDVNRCRAAALDPAGGDFAVFALANADTNVDFLYLLGEDEPQLLTSPTEGDGDGITGLAVSAADEQIYVGRKQFFGAPEDGVYVLDAQSGALEPVLTSPDLSLADLDVDPVTGTLYALSDGFGAGDFENKVVEIADPGGAATLRVFADPFTFFTSSNRRLTDLEVVRAGAERAVFVLNNSFEDGEEIARFALGGAGVLFASETDILGDPDVASGDYAVPAPTSALRFDPTDERLFLLNTDRFGGADEALVVGDLFATSTESEGVRSAAALAAYPNPAAGEVAVVLTLERPQSVRAAVYDVLGRQVAVLHDGPAPATLRLRTAALPAGTYLVRATGPGVAAAVRATVVR